MHDDYQDFDPKAPLTLLESLTPFTLPAVKPLSAADLYDLWMIAEADATLALADWMAAPRRSKAETYAAYADALDREAEAAGALQARVQRAAAA
jgi:hypothetical protein